LTALVVAGGFGIWALDRFGIQFVEFSMNYEPVAPLLPPDNIRPYTLVFDVNDLFARVQMEDGSWCRIIRPDLPFMMEYTIGQFEVILWNTAQNQWEGEPVMARLDPNRIATHLYRKHAAGRQMRTIKDITLLGRPIEKVIIFSSDPFSCYPLSNVINIPVWDGNPNDFALEDVSIVLELLAAETPKDVRPFVDEHSISSSIFSLFEDMDK